MMTMSSSEEKTFKDGQKNPSWVYMAKGDRHSIYIDEHGRAYSFGKSNVVGQLGRPAHSKRDCKEPGQVQYDGSPSRVHAVKAFVSNNGGDVNSGHSAILDNNGQLWMAGCDRWQQLGLGSPQGGSSGYTWKHGKLWQEIFVPVVHLNELLEGSLDSSSSPKNTIRDVALGGDHTLVLSSNKKDVYTFGKGGDGQLGLVGKPFVSAPTKSKLLSSSKAEVAAVCAVEACSMTLDDKGRILAKAGSCSQIIKAPSFQILLNRCLGQAKGGGLLNEPAKS